MPVLADKTAAVCAIDTMDMFQGLRIKMEKNSTTQPRMKSTRYYDKNGKNKGEKRGKGKGEGGT